MSESGRAQLEVSVSFGKFENDSLSWEKWSSFSPNKYLEEVEKCSTPGSVAQKKAYFEAHYKKIAARKVDQLEPADHSRSQESKEETLVESTSVVENSFGPSNGDGSESEVREPTVICPMNSETADESKDAGGVDIECNSSSLEEVKEEKQRDSPEISNRDEIVEVEEETPPEDVVEQKLKAEIVKKDKNLKGHTEGADRKIHPSLSEPTSSGTRKTLASPTLKSSKPSAPRSSPAPTSKVVSSSPPLTRKANGSSSLPKIKKTPATENKKPAPRSLVSSSPQSSAKTQNGLSSLQRGKNSPSPIADNKRITRTSLHMSLSLSPASQNTMRKSVITEPRSANSMASRGAMGRSLIMDRMADKEIVRRAFKTFRTSLNDEKSSADKRYSGQEQITSKGPEQKSSTSLTPRGENGRFGKPDQRATTQKGPSVPKSGPVSSRTTIDTGAERRKMMTTKPSNGSTNDGTNETLKKEGAKPKTHRPIK